MKQFWVYLMSNKPRRLYTGMPSDLGGRVSGLLRFKIGIFVKPWHSALQEIPAATNALGAGWQSPSTYDYHLLRGARTCVPKNVNAGLWYARPAAYWTREVAACAFSE